MDLIQPKTTINSAVLIKLSTGEEIIGLYTSETPDTLVLRSPLIVHFQVDQNSGQAQVGLVDLSYFANNKRGEFTFNKNSLLLLPYRPNQQLESHYYQQTTGIVPASSLTI